MRSHLWTGSRNHFVCVCVSQWVHDVCGKLRSRARLFSFEAVRWKCSKCVFEDMPQIDRRVLLLSSHAAAAEADKQVKKSHTPKVYRSTKCVVLALLHCVRGFCDSRARAVAVGTRAGRSSCATAATRTYRSPRSSSFVRFATRTHTTTAPIWLRCGRIWMLRTRCGRASTALRRISTLSSRRMTGVWDRAYARVPVGVRFMVSRRRIVAVAVVVPELCARCAERLFRWERACTASAASRYGCMSVLIALARTNELCLFPGARMCAPSICWWQWRHAECGGAAERRDVFRNANVMWICSGCIEVEEERQKVSKSHHRVQVYTYVSSAKGGSELVCA